MLRQPHGIPHILSTTSPPHPTGHLHFQPTTHHDTIVESLSFVLVAFGSPIATTPHASINYRLLHIHTFHSELQPCASNFSICVLTCCHHDLHLPPAVYHHSLLACLKRRAISFGLHVAIGAPTATNSWRFTALGSQVHVHARHTTPTNHLPPHFARVLPSARLYL